MAVRTVKQVIAWLQKKDPTGKLEVGTSSMPDSITVLERIGPGEHHINAELDVEE